VTRVRVTAALLRPGDRIVLRVGPAGAPFPVEVIHTTERIAEGKIEIFALREDGATNVYDVAATATLEADRPGA